VFVTRRTTRITRPKDRNRIVGVRARTHEPQNGFCYRWRTLPPPSGRSLTLKKAFRNIGYDKINQ